MGKFYLKEIASAFIVDSGIFIDSFILDIHAVDGEFDNFSHWCYHVPVAVFQAIVHRIFLSLECLTMRSKQMNDSAATCCDTFPKKYLRERNGLKIKRF